MTTRKIAGETRRRIVLFNVGGMGWHPPSWARQQDKPKWAVEARSKFFAQTVWAGCVAPTALGAPCGYFPALTRWANLCHASGVWWRANVGGSMEWKRVVARKNGVGLFSAGETKIGCGLGLARNLSLRLRRR